MLPLIENSAETLPLVSISKTKLLYTRESIVYSRLLSLVLVTTLGLLGTELEVLSSLEGKLLLGLTFLTFETKDDLTCGLGLLVKDGLGLSTKSHLLSTKIVATILCWPT